MKKIFRYWATGVVMAVLAGGAVNGQTVGRSEVYSHRFTNGDDDWKGMYILQRNTYHAPIHIGWQRTEQDTLGGILLSFAQAQEGDFLFIYKLFGGLKPSSLYRLSFLSSFTVEPSEESSSVHLKLGANDLRPKTLYNRGNFSKGKGAASGKNLAYLGDLTAEDSTMRYVEQNYDEPVYAVTNTEGNLYVMLGVEKGKGGGGIPPVSLNTLRIRFEYVGEDSVEKNRVFFVETTETDRKNVYSYAVNPVQEVVRYSIYTQQGHLVMVEDDSDCVPSCPNIIDASFLAPDDYWVEFVLLNEKRIVQPFVVRP